MESDIVSDAIEDSERWLRTAKVLIQEKIYDKGLYALEMSLEIGIKAYLVATDTDYQKSHRVGDVFLSTVEEKKNIATIEFKKSASTITDLFQELLDYRTASGYTFDSRVKMSQFKKKGEQNLPKVETALGQIRNEIEKMRKHIKRVK